MTNVGVNNLSAGITIKCASNLIAGGDKTFSSDVGLLYNFNSGISIGLTFLNMGPTISYRDKDLYQPIPFTIRLALALQREFIVSNLRLIGLSCEYNLHREFVYCEPNKKPEPFWSALFKSLGDEPVEEELSEIIHNTGCEFTLLNTCSIRHGVLIGGSSSESALHSGLGANLFNHFNFDFHLMYVLKNSIDRNLFWGFSLSFYNMFRWSKKDCRWWRNSID